ncbi:MAG: hypothetical protein E7634_06275 [Ruminococcaceae bacterium]|nr:hypothetical protein [Oscillospiraceae bacterium]
MDKKAKWIWYYGDYEIFHSLLLHERRQEFGNDYPCFWNQSHVYPSVYFYKSYVLPVQTSFTAYVNGVGYVVVNGTKYATGAPIKCAAGENKIEVRVSNARGLPAVFIEGETVFTNETWCARIADEEAAVGAHPEYTSKDDNVEVFPFSYRKFEYVSVENTGNGFLYDFGRESFGMLIMKGVKNDTGVYYGESREEALDMANALIREDIPACDEIELRSRAFRYVFLKTTEKPENVYLNYEYLPLVDIGSFSCNDPDVEKIYDLCSYTFHLNSREFFLDGIKRDRWVWSGDAYQSFMVNRYLYADKEITKRTINALLGKPPYVQHINTINDYSFYLMISVYDYWFETADTAFVKNVYDRLYGLYEFCVSRLDENGFVHKVCGDWIFVDWAILDKQGPMCAEQILLWYATKCMKKLAKIAGKKCACAVDTDALKEKIFKYYYKAERGGFIDGYESGRNIINRQQNVLALLYDFTDEEQSKLIMEKVLKNPDVPPITTPYFEFFELLAMCKNGNVEYAQNMISSYWGGMKALGATSIWEQFDPTETGAEHYAMYGQLYGRSLCHAWGSGPICILGKYVAGVRPTSEGSKTYEVRPHPGKYKSFTATVPIEGGKVTVKYGENGVTVTSTRDGGKLIYAEKEYVIEKNRALSVK